MPDEASEFYECPVLGRPVELTAERRRHIETKHEIDAEALLAFLPALLAAPTLAFRSTDNPAEFLLAREFELSSRRKFIVAIIVSQAEPPRFWIVTAFVARRPGGERWTAI